MTREEKIISGARIVLNDTNAERWTDTRLYALLESGQEELCRELPIIVQKHTFVVVPGQVEYFMPSDYVKALTAVYAGRSLPFASMQEFDNMTPDWELHHSGTITHIIVNNMGQRAIRPYPVLSKDADSGVLSIRYSALPPKLNYDATTGELENNLVTPAMWDEGLKQYVISQAFLDYGDQMSISRSQVAARIYGGIMSKAAKLARQGSSNKIAKTSYQQGV